jgi:plastocyanin
MHRIAAPLFVLSLFALTACGGNGTSATTAPANVDLTVRAKAAVAFDQPSYTAALRADGTLAIALINDSSLPHNLHVVDGDGNDVDKNAPKVRVSGNGDESNGTFHLDPGAYRIVCKVPGHSNMNSAFTVTK